MKLEMKYLAPYLHYDLNIKVGLRITSIAKLTCYVTDADSIAMNYVLDTPAYKPMLRPLSDLSKEIEHPDNCTFEQWIEGEYDIMIGSFIPLCGIEKLPYEVMEYLFEWHFDVFNLIPAGLAVKK